MSTKIRIGGFLDLSTVDWFRHVSFMVFCAGCNFRCLFCSNSPLISMDSGKDVDLIFIKKRILENKELIDAVGFSGGEPMLQSKPLIELCEWAKKIGIKTFVNTNGSCPEAVMDLANRKLLDYLALDVKAPLNPRDYGRVIGLSGDVEEIVRNVKETMQICIDFGIPIEARTTVVPTLMDDEDSIRNIAKSVKNCDLYVIQQFYPFKEVLDRRLRKEKPPKRKTLIELAKVSLGEGLENVYIRTREHGMERVSLT